MSKPIINPFREIKYLKNSRIKKDIMPLLTNSNLGK